MNSDIFTIDIGGQTYRQFIHHPHPVRDGTLRCISCGQIDEPEYHMAEFCPGMGGALPQTDNVRAFIAANAKSPVIIGNAFQNGGGKYRLKDGRIFRFDLHESRSMKQPRWDLSA